MSLTHRLASLRQWSLAAGFSAALAAAAEPGLLFHVSGDHGTTADVAASGMSQPTFDAQITPVADGARGGALSCGDTQLLAWRAPGNIYAQRGTLSFFWRSRYPVGPTEFPVFRVGYADHSSWDMVWLRIDYNGHGFDAFVTDASLARTRVSVTLPEFPQPDQWTHLALAWDETRGIRFYVNGRLAATRETTAVYDAALDQFGPHSRIISPYQVQSAYNFVRGGDVDEIKIHDRMLDEAAVAVLAKGAEPTLPPPPARRLSDPAVRAEWLHRYGWDHTAPTELPAPHTRVRKVEIHDAYDLKRWWWKGTDGIRETTWPGVYNRSRLPGRLDYFTLPDWDCYSLSGKAITFALPDEPVNHIEISGAAWGRMELLPTGTENETASEAKAEAVLFERPKGREKTGHALTTPLAGRKIRFTNVEQEEPIGELAAYNVTTGTEPAGSATLSYNLGFVRPVEDGVKSLGDFITGRFAPDERAMLIARPEGTSPAAASSQAMQAAHLPLVHVLIPDTWDGRPDGLDGIALDLPACKSQPTHGDLIAFNIRVKDPLWPLRDMLDFSFSVKPGTAHTLWLDLRDRMLPPGRPLYLTIASAAPEFAGLNLTEAKLRLVFKPRAAARAEHELDRFTQARDSYAMLVEEFPRSDKFALWVRFESDLKDLLRINPDHVLGRQYAAVGMDAPRPGFTQPPAPAGVPLWAFRQVEALRRARKFTEWWIDHRQIANGEFGGGLSDDTDLTNLWPGVALMGAAPEKHADSIRRQLDACYAQGMFMHGLPSIQTDELHCYEEGINSLAQNLMLDHGSPRQLERAMETARGTEGITGVNAAGHRHIRTSYFSGTRIAGEDPWGDVKRHSYLMLQPTQMLVDYNGNPAAKKLLLDLADSLLAHRRPDGKGGQTTPVSIRFRDDRELPSERGYFPWPLFWSSWRWTGDKRYLDPIFDGGTDLLMAVNANAIDTLGVRAEWGPRILAEGPDAPRPYPARVMTNWHFGWMLTGDKSALEKLYGRLIEDMALGEFIYTEGSLWIDRVGVPTSELQRARLGGVALVRNATLPGHAVSWTFAAPAGPESVALLIPDASPTSFKVIAHNLSTAPVHATMTGGNIDPGQWEITQGIDTDGDDRADGSLATRTQKFERSQSVELTLAPGATTVLTCRLKTPGTPYWARPDLGIDPADVVVQGGMLHVTVHGLGSVPSPATPLVLRDATGRTLARGEIPALAAPVDLWPKTEVVTLPLPAGADLDGARVEIDPERHLEEITVRNNTVKLQVP
ncbi:MAG: hypothetical protein JNG82_10575 [Opitutaceae bacterium]|nr:hypothetical protein [Opitutaceae bacterium]